MRARSVLRSSGRADRRAEATREPAGARGSDDVVLRVEGLSKKFCLNLRRSLWYGVKDLGGELALRKGSRERLRRDEFWALRDISFDLRRGETLGLIGHNGAGKTTLLKIINGLIKPDEGTIRVRGSVGALIALGAGFSPVLTGRENIYVNGAVLGLSRKEIDRRLDDIIGFAEIGEFIDAPVQSYSSGMQVRLGFSIASNLDPDLLLIDEILSVGDASFRRRCINRLDEYKNNGGTIIFVSHNSAAVARVSDRVLMLKRGCVAAYADPGTVVERYEWEALEAGQEAEARLRRQEAADDGARLKVGVTVRDLQGNPRSELEFGESFEVRIGYESVGRIPRAYFTMGIHAGAGRHDLVTSTHMAWNGASLTDLSGTGVVGCRIMNPVLSPGMYSVSVAVLSDLTGALGGEKWLVPARSLGSFSVIARGMRRGLPGIAAQAGSGFPPVVLSHSWTVDGEELASYRTPDGDGLGR